MEKKDWEIQSLQEEETADVFKIGFSGCETKFILISEDIFVICRKLKIDGQQRYNKKSIEVLYTNGKKHGLWLDKEQSWSIFQLEIFV